MKPFVARLMAAAALLSIPAALSAHRMWLLPSATVFSGTDGWVTVDAAVSNDLFFFDHQPLRLDGMKVWQPDGSEGTLQNGATGRYRSVFDVKLDKPGTWKIGTQMSAVMGSFKVDGVEKRLGGRRGPPQPNAPAPLTVADIPANATDVKVTEVSGRNEIFVTAGAPTTTVFKTTGKGLEFAPITHPDELVAGETAKFRFLVDGKPAAGLKVTVIPGGKRYRNDEGARELTTGADGVLSVSWPTAGMYWLNATLTDAKATTPRATERRMSYVTTLEVLTP
ncbi:putative GH25 family protein [Sphingomonas sp. PP-CE-3G-477]|uniref:DUF4198 domain-containing protein n=1 Tax=Sphingomonas sp. PP-CE-3G-477 TaxID=2135660 RepID=UPI000D338998|nr:DUF4198 domain-containing protein [Sphingomonas sp. PP-CE-3G-477]PTQ65651.1 putative GH25 family protein [Sphingomonas sp. PP-CE-3G-477]